MIRRLLPLVLLLAATATRGDEVLLQNGRKVVGKARWTPAGLRVETRHGVMLLEKEQVREVISCESPEEAFARRRAALAPGDLPGAVALAACALRSGLEAEGRALLVRVVEHPPVEEEGQALLAARREATLRLLGCDYHQVDGRWIAPEVWYPANGYVRRDGKWVTARDAARARAAETAEETARVAGRASESEDEAKAALARAEEAVEALEASREEALERAKEAQAALDEACEEARTCWKSETDADREASGKWTHVASHTCDAHGRDCPEECEAAAERAGLEEEWQASRDARAEADGKLAAARRKQMKLEREARAARKAFSCQARKLARARDELAACRAALERLAAKAERARQESAEAWIEAAELGHRLPPPR